MIAPVPGPSIVALDEALDEFSRVEPRRTKVVELRYSGGLTEEEIVSVLKIRCGPCGRLGSWQGMVDEELQQ